MAKPQDFERSGLLSRSSAHPSILLFKSDTQRGNYRFNKVDDRSLEEVINDDGTNRLYGSHITPRSSLPYKIKKPYVKK